MVEVFKTNVMEPSEADMLLEQIHRARPDYKANFDLEDCDKILRISFASGTIDTSFFVNLLSTFGFIAEVLQDEEPRNKNNFQNSIFQTSSSIL